MKRFKKGDKVKLISGGPSMTVQESSQKFENDKPLEVYNVLCNWFANDEFKNQWFDQEVLLADNQEPLSDFEAL